MANQIRIKRRASTGSAGAPASLLNAELAYNEADNILYYGFGDNGSGVATSVVAIAGSGNGLTLGGTQEVTGDKTFSGLVDLTGTFKIDGVEVTATAAEINHLVGVTSGVQGQFDALVDDVSNLQTATGFADGETSYGTATVAGFSGNTVSDDATVKQALIDIETALEGSNADAVDLRTLSGTADGDTSYGTAASRSFEVIGDSATTLSALQALDADAHELGLNQADLISLSGVAENGTDLGTFTNSMITPGRTIKQALEQVGQAAEDNETDLSNLTTAVGNTNPSDLGLFTGSTLNDSETVKSALQKIVTELEDGSGSLTADDSNTADFASGTVTISGDTGISTTASGNELKIDLDDTAVTAAAYGAADTVPTYTVDQQGRLTAAADVTIDIVHTQVSDFDAGVQANTLDSLAQPVANVALNNQRITGLADPVGDQDAVNKQYADALVTGLDVKQSVRAATTANITLSGTQAVDGVNLGAGDRVLVKDQTDGKQNGIYDVVDGGAWTRSSDADNSPAGEVTSGMYTYVEEGSTNADAGFILQTTGAIVLGTTSLSFVQFTGAGQISAGAGLAKTGNVLDIGTADVARIVVNANDIDLATHGTAGTYNGLTVDAYGRVSSFVTPTTLAGYAITDAQPLDATLTALAGVTFAADQMVYATGDDAFAVTNLTSFARSILDDADAATARGTLGLDTMATQAASAVAITGGTIDNVVFDGGTF